LCKNSKKDLNLNCIKKKDLVEKIVQVSLCYKSFKFKYFGLLDKVAGYKNGPDLQWFYKWAI
jgi:hypothetical protein